MCYDVIKTMRAGFSGRQELQEPTRQNNRFAVYEQAAGKRKEGHNEKMDFHDFGTGSGSEYRYMRQRFW